MIIGVTGGVGVGKSTVLSILKDEYGAAIIMADDVAKELMVPEKSSYNVIVDFFGDDILTGESGSEINRNRLSEIVFNDKGKLEKLNSMTHPLVKIEIQKLLCKYKALGCKYIVLESAILLEAGYETLCDELWFVNASYEVRLERLKRDRGYTKEKTDNIINNQKTEKEFMERADFIIDNSGTLDNTQRQIALHLNNERDNNN